MSKLTPEQRDKLDAYNQGKEQLQTLQDIADMTQEMLRVVDEQGKSGDKTVESIGALLIDMRESLNSLNKKELDMPDYAKPVVDAVGKLENSIAKAIKSIDIKPDAPQVNVEPSRVDLKGVESAIAQIPKAFKEAIALIPKVSIPKADYSSLLTAWEGISQQLQSIDTATRMKPQPGSISINNTSDNPVPVSASIDTAGLATEDKQDDIITAIEAISVGSSSNGNITDGVDTAIKATVKDLSNSNPLATQIMDANGDAITSFGGGTQYTDGDADATPTGTVALGFDGTNVKALATDSSGNLQVDILSMPAGGSGLTDAELRASDVKVTLDGESVPVTGTFWQATQPVSGTVTANLSATDNAVLDNIVSNQTDKSQFTKITDGTLTATVRDTGSSDSLNVAIVDASGNQITSFGGDTSLLATSAKQDTIIGHVDGIETVLGTIDTDTGAMVTDLAAIEVLLTGIDADTDAIKTAAQLIDNAISGSEMQVDVVGALPAGTNAIGKLAANSGVDIGDVTLNNALNAGTSDASTIRVTESTGATATLSNVSGSASSVTLIAADTSRRKVVLYNDSTEDCYVKYGSTASTTSFTWLMAAGSHIEEEHYNGIITGIWNSATGSMRVSEIS